MRKSFLIVALIFLIACSGNIENKKSITLSSGRTIEVTFEKQIHEEREPFLFVDYVNEEKVIKVKTVENEAIEIWERVKEEAEKIEVKEALIKYSYFTGRTKDSGEKEYGSTLFNAEKIESGEWKLIKVN